MAVERSIAELHQRILDRAGGAWFDFEQLVREVYYDTIKPGDWALDVGASHGSHLFQMAPLVAPDGRVIAIEAAPANAAALKFDLANHYRAMAPHVVLVNAGAYDTTGKTVFYFVPDHLGLGSLKDRPNVQAEKVEVEVDLKRIDDIVGQPQRRVTFIKLDIEGAELMAMRGASRTIAACKPVMVFEFDTVSSAAFGYDAEEMLGFMADMDYAIYDFFGNRLQRSIDFDEARIWNYLALPNAYAIRDELFARLKRYISTNFGVEIDDPAQQASALIG